MKSVKFLSLLPAIQEPARYAFRGEESERRQELTAEVIANCWAAFVRLVERGLIDVVYPTPLAQYAIKQVRDGRRVGAKLNVRDVSSEYCQARKRIIVERLDRFDERKGEWKEVLIEDRHAGPPETAAARIDIADSDYNLAPKFPPQEERVPGPSARQLLTPIQIPATASALGTT